MVFIKSRIKREKQTVAAMIKIYCRNNHNSTDLCPECSHLKEYAFYRLDKCPYGDAKPICSKCPIHCYSQEMREKIREVMRFSGPKMLLPHPFLSIMHLFDSKIEPMLKSKKNKTNLNQQF